MTFLPNDMPPHFILAVLDPEVQRHLEELINAHLAECPGCMAWKEQHPGADWRRFVSKSQL